MRDTILPPQLQEEEAGNQTVPPVDQNTGLTGSLTLTEMSLQQTLLSALPQEFPVSALEADIKPDCTIKLTVEVDRSKLTKYLENAGMKLSLKEKIFLRLLPKTLEAECLLQLSQTDESGMVLLTPQSLSLNEHKVKIASIPQKLVDAANTGLSETLNATGLTLGEFVCTEDAIVFR